MRTVRKGDRVRVHYRKVLDDGGVSSSRKRAPLELTVGISHPWLPGLGFALVGLMPGNTVRVRTPPGVVYGFPDPGRIREWARSRFPADQHLESGQWVRVPVGRSRHRRVKILDVRNKTVIVDTNHRGAGQGVEFVVKLLAIQGDKELPDIPYFSGPNLIRTAQIELPHRGRVVAVGVDPGSLEQLGLAFPDWTIESVQSETVGTVQWGKAQWRADLLIIGNGDEDISQLALCQVLSSQPSLAGVPLLVLIHPERKGSVQSWLDAGADSCLMLPLHEQEVIDTLCRVRRGNQPGRHTEYLDAAQCVDLWRDDGGEA